MVQYNNACDDREMYDFARLHSPKLSWNPLKGPYEAILPQKQGLGFRGICLAQAQEQKICLLLGLLGLSRHSGSDICQGSGRTSLKGQGDLVSSLISPITHIVTLLIAIINLRVKPPAHPETKR